MIATSEIPSTTKPLIIMNTDAENTDDANIDTESTENKSAELPTLSQSQMLNHLRTWLETYAELIPGVQMLAGTTIEFGENSDFDEGSDWPGETDQMRVDALLRLRQDAGGKSRVVGGRVEGAPELVVKMFDGVAYGAMHNRMLKYEEMGITESIIADEEGTLPWYSPGMSVMYSGENEVVSGTTFPGLALNLDHFYRDDRSAQRSQLRERVRSVTSQQLEEMRSA